MKDSGIDFYNSFFGKYLLSVGNSTLIVLLTTRVGCRVSSYERRRAAGQPSMKQEPDDIPVICRLSDAELRAREATLLAQFRRAVIATQELPDGYSFRLPGDKKSLAGVAELIAARLPVRVVSALPIIRERFVRHVSRIDGGAHGNVA